MLSIKLPRVAAPTQLFPRFADQLPQVHEAFESVAQRMLMVKSDIENVPLAVWNKKRNRSKKKLTAISRSFHKMEELVDHFGLQVKGQVLALAEAPGGFMQCLLQNQAPGTTFHVMSLISPHDEDVPKLHPAIARQENVTVHFGKTGDGDITRFSNIESLIAELSGPVDLVTADGGYNERDFNKKEQHHLRLIFAEFCTAIAVRASQVVIKLFDIHTLPTIQLATLACALYDNVYICKPPGSRPTNSEKYLVMSGFSEVSVGEKVFELFKIILSNYQHVHSLFLDEVPDTLMSVLHHLAETVLESQTKSIQDILSNINVDLQNERLYTSAR